MHSRLEKQSVKHAEMINAVNTDKDILIQQNSQLKKALSEAQASNEMLKSQVESFHGKLLTAEAMLDAERRKVESIKASQGDFSELEEELKQIKAARRKISQQIDDTLIEINKQEGVASQRYLQMNDEYKSTQEENKVLNDEIKAKDDIIKTLTKENLLINSKITQLTALLVA